MGPSMRVLHLPNNIASQPGILVGALRALGVEARAVTRNNAPIQSPQHVETHVVRSVRTHPWSGGRDTIRWWWSVWRAIAWADVVHWHFDSRAMPCDIDLHLVARGGKGRLVEFWGSDIRDPELAVRDNPYLAHLLADPSTPYAISPGRSRRAQTRFARHGFACVVPGPELPAYVGPGSWPAVYRSEAVVDLAALTPVPPDPARARPLVVHVPSNALIKGTASVLDVVGRLRDRFVFDFRLIEGVTHAAAMDLVRQADIVLDQFVIGAFGLVSLEAMAMAKPAVCYLTPGVRAACPADIPIVDASADDLYDTLATLLTDGPRRRAIGILGPPYVARHHDAKVVARGLVGAYEECLAAARRQRR
jgi:hypothetical protein